MIERFQNLPTGIRLAIFIAAIVLIVGILYYASLAEEPTTPDETESPLPTSVPTVIPPTEPPTEGESPTEEPTTDPTTSEPTTNTETLEPVTPDEYDVTSEERDAAEAFIITALPEMYAIRPSETLEERAERLTQYLDYPESDFEDIVSWGEIAALGYETSGTIGWIESIGGTKDDLRFNVGMTVYTATGATGTSGLPQISEDFNVYQVAVRYVDGEWQIWAVDEG